MKLPSPLKTVIATVAIALATPNCKPESEVPVVCTDENKLDADKIYNNANDAVVKYLNHESNDKIETETLRNNARSAISDAMEIRLLLNACQYDVRLIIDAFNSKNREMDNKKRK